MAIYDLSSSVEQARLDRYVSRLKRGGKRVRLEEITERSIQQNKYLHVIIGGFSLEFGYTPEEGKMIYKMCSKELFFYEKDGINFIKSSADLTVNEMTESISAFRSYSQSLGCYLPEPHEQDVLLAIQMEIENQKHHWK